MTFAAFVFLLAIYLLILNWDEQFRWIRWIWSISFELVILQTISRNVLFYDTARSLSITNVEFLRRHFVWYWYEESSMLPYQTSHKTRDLLKGQKNFKKMSLINCWWFGMSLVFTLPHASRGKCVKNVEKRVTKLFKTCIYCMFWISNSISARYIILMIS